MAAGGEDGLVNSAMNRDVLGVGRGFVAIVRVFPAGRGLYAGFGSALCVLSVVNGDDMGLTRFGVMDALRKIGSGGSKEGDGTESQDGGG
jgi:hypothetical protein